MKRNFLMTTVLVLTLLVAIALSTSPASTLAAPDMGMMFQSPVPTNDNFAAAEPIEVGQSTTVDTSAATTEEGEPIYPSCAYGPIGNTVWYSFTPVETSSVTVYVSTSYMPWGPVSVAYTGSSLDSLSELDCRSSDSAGATFKAEAGTTYYIQVGGMYNASDNLTITLQPAPAPSIWFHVYPYNPYVRSTVSFSYGGSSPDVGTIESYEWDLGDGTPGFGQVVNYQYTDVGQYTVRLTIMTRDGRTATAEQTLYVDVAPPPSVGFYFSPDAPAIGDAVTFSSYAWDPANIGIASYAWNFGDGTTAAEPSVTHQYAADGDYTVQLKATTTDGREGLSAQVVRVRTRDVAITKFSAPQAAKAGQARQISVGILNKRSETDVRVYLYKSVPSGFEPVGMLDQFVPVRSGNRTVEFGFNYTFTNEDARVGKATFKAVAVVIEKLNGWVVERRDVWPADNEAISSPTKVNP
ncbi:MAG: PKD domain-containing protein [Caldilineaceae bacterium]|nr:PKD domain-containing protein [Caldilineaceae bacterium]